MSTTNEAILGIIKEKLVEEIGNFFDVRIFSSALNFAKVSNEGRVNGTYGYIGFYHYSDNSNLLTLSMFKINGHILFERIYADISDPNFNIDDIVNVIIINRRRGR